MISALAGGTAGGAGYTAGEAHAGDLTGEGLLT